MADYFTDFSFEIKDVTPEQAEWLTKEIESDEDMFVEAEYNENSRRFWFHSGDGQPSAEGLDEILQRFLKKYQPDKYISYETVFTCSKPRTDGFGGQAVFITKDRIDWIDLTSWIANKRLKFENKAKAHETRIPA